MGRRWLTVSTILSAIALAGTACVGPFPDVPGTGVWGTTSSGGQPEALPTSVSQVPTAQPGTYPNSRPPGPPSSSAPSLPPQGQFSPPPNKGPVTGYGSGGIGARPGAPPNQPY